jgi:TolB-like protein/tetratricopeptide (TPR) repeat protein
MERSAEGNKSTGLWDRLKEHKVAQWSLAYVAAAYTLLQGVEMVSAAFEWPHIIVRVLTLVLIVGFPVVVLLAWYHGHKAQRRISGTELTLLIVLLVIAGALLWAFSRTGHERKPVTAEAPVSAAAPAADAVPEKSVAVLPFLDMSEKKDQEYFSDGLTEELIGLLTKDPDLRIPARTSSFYFKDKRTSIGDIAKALHVAHILEGSVRKSGDRLRVTAQLIRVDNGYHVWSETYDRRLTDVFKVQDDIAAAVVLALKATLLPGRTVASAGPKNTDAYNLYLHGLYLLRRQSVADVDKSIDYFRDAIQRDSAYAPAHVELALAYIFQYSYGNGDNGTRVKARMEAQEAVRLDPNLASAHFVLARLSLSDFDWTTVAAETERASSLDPNNADGYYFRGILVRIHGRTEESIPLFRQAATIDPLRAELYVLLAATLNAAGNPVEAERNIKLALEFSPDITKAHFFLAMMQLQQGHAQAALDIVNAETGEWYRLEGQSIVLFALGRKAESDAALAQLREKYADSSAVQIAEAYAYRHEIDNAFQWLERAYQQRDAGLPWIKTNPLYKNLRGDPRYDALLRKMKLAS